MVVEIGITYIHITSLWEHFILFEIQKFSLSYFELNQKSSSSFYNTIISAVWVSSSTIGFEGKVVFKPETVPPLPFFISRGLYASRLCKCPNKWRFIAKTLMRQIPFAFRCEGYSQHYSALKHFPPLRNCTEIIKKRALLSPWQKQFFKELARRRW